MIDVTERARDVFDDWARRGRAEGMERGHGPTARQAFDRLAIAPGSRYLDIGCGNGYTVRWAAAIDGVEAVGVDVSEEMIARATEAAGDLPNARFVCDRFPSEALAGQRFDAIFSMEVFYYFGDLGAGLRAARELLAPGGRFACVVDFYEENAASHDWPEQLDLPLHRLSESGWRDAFAAAGLEVVDQRRLKRELADGETPTWKHTAGSLMTLGTPARSQGS